MAAQFERRGNSNIESRRANGRDSWRTIKWDRYRPGPAFGETRLSWPRPAGAREPLIRLVSHNENFHLPALSPHREGQMYLMTCISGHLRRPGNGHTNPVYTSQQPNRQVN